jgi:uncharacterized linocin/CFP29 family protein
MNDLLRELAPISTAAWQEIEAEAKRTLVSMLAARRVVDFSGPLGWNSSAVGLGRATDVPAPQPGVQARVRTVLPLVELRVPFELSRRELEAVTRGARDADLEPLRAAAREAARAEDVAVFHGYPQAGIRGIGEATADGALAISNDYTDYPTLVAAAINNLRSAGVDGPYAILLGPRCYTGLIRTTASGFPVIEHVRRLLDGPIVWAPAVDGAIVMSTRGDDFELTVGQDFSIGYLDHTADQVRLYLQESFTFRVLTPEAAIPLVYPAQRAGEPDAAPR